MSTATKLTTDAYDRMVAAGILPETNRLELIDGRIVEKDVKNPVALGRGRAGQGRDCRCCSPPAGSSGPSSRCASPIARQRARARYLGGAGSDQGLSEATPWP